jgi:hypothetical protein
MRFSRKEALAAAAVGVLPAWGVGVAAMIGHGVALGMPLVNVAAVLVGMAVLLVMGGWIARVLLEHPGGVGAVVVALLVLPFAFESLEGVHRWVMLGPVRLHVSSMVGPIALLCVARLVGGRRSTEAVLLIAALGAAHIAQPDAGQATALGVGVVVIVVRAEESPLVRGVGSIVAVAGVSAAWLRPDPLEAVAWVEDVLPRVFEHGVVGGVVAVLALAALPGAALLGGRGRPCVFGTTAALAVAAYFVATVGVTLMGCFPMPVLGHGASPIVGAIVGIGVLRGGLAAHDLRM